MSGNISTLTFSNGRKAYCCCHDRIRLFQRVREIVDEDAVLSLVQADHKVGSLVPLEWLQYAYRRLGEERKGFSAFVLSSVLKGRFGELEGILVIAPVERNVGGKLQKISVSGLFAEERLHIGPGRFYIPLLQFFNDRLQGLRCSRLRWEDTGDNAT